MIEPEKKRPGRWKAGTSGNAAGRPKGSGEVGKLRASIAARLPQLLDAMMTRALEGDVAAAKLLMERTLPALKPTEQSISLALPEGGTLTSKAAAVMAAACAGSVEVGQAVALLNALGVMAKIQEVDFLTARVQALEDAQHGND